MKYYGGTVDTTTIAPVANSTLVMSIEGSVTIVTARGAEFTLHRKPNSRHSASFYKVFSDYSHTPVFSYVPNAYTLFTVEGDIIGEGEYLTLHTDDGHSERHLVRQMTVHPAPKVWPPWMRSSLYR